MPRLRDFPRDALTRSLEQRRSVQGTLTRSTIHIVSATDWPLLRCRDPKGPASVVEARHRRGQQAGRHGGRRPAHARTAGRRSAARHRTQGITWRQGLPEICLVGTPGLARPGSHTTIRTWDQRRADLYALADTWLGPKKAAEKAGLAHLVRRYLGGFGPAPLADIADWAGIGKSALSPVVEKLSLRRFRDERGREPLDLPGAALPDATTPAPVRFLPTWDATLLVHARRTQILPEPYRPLVFNRKTPHSVPTFLVDGAVAGKWRYEKGRIQLEPFDSLPRKVRGELGDEARRLAEFHKD